MIRQAKLLNLSLEFIKVEAVRFFHTTAAFIVPNSFNYNAQFTAVLFALGTNPKQVKLTVEKVYHHLLAVTVHAIVSISGLLARVL